ncbi:MAG: S8 family serine peptidase, partial [Chloroflexi bacterium]|nr:S8 family serine peptidase [Chloroflexota bacterium]
MRLVLVALLGLVLLLIPLLLWASAPPSEAYASLSTAIETVAPAQAVPELAANPADQHLTEQKGAPPIRLKSRTFTPAPGVGRALKGQLERLQAKAVDRAHVFLQFNKIPDKAERQALAARGVELLTYIPDRAWLASVPVTLNLDDLIASSPARWAGAILPGDKLETDLREGTIHKWAQDVDERVILVAQFFPDVDLEVGADLVTAYRGKVLHRVESINSLVVSLPQDAVNELAAEDIVEWIEQVEPALSPVNDGVRANIGADALQAAPYNLDGTGVRVLVFDGGGVDTTHPDFGGRVSLQSDAPGVSDHATHVAGTVGGDGSRSVAAGGTAQQWRGMAPNVRMFSDDYDAGAGPYIFYNNPGSIEVDYNEGVVTNTVDMVNTSLGMNLCGNYVDPDQVLPLDNPALVGLYGDYTSSAQLLDNIATGNWTGNVRLPLFWSAGNERNDTCFNHFDPQGHQTIDPPHAAKNPVIVGAINSNDSSMTTFSGYGPVDDGRLKPDVVGPGCQTSVDFAVTSTFTDTFYTQMCGTSMSTPAVTGVAALLLQQWRQTCAASDPLPSTYKALLVNTAQDLGNPGPDYAFGWGRVQAQLAADAIINQEVVEGSITHGGVYTYYVAMQSGGPQLRVTLAWDDPAAAPLSAVQLINNLDLFVIGPGTTMHRAWLLDPINPGNNATTGIDNLNNVEQVVVPTPVDGTYTVIVSGTNVPSGPQPFSLSIQPIELFVNSTADTSDGNPGDGICDTGTFATPTGICTLRAAIEEANATCGSDTIKFNIPAATDPGCNAGTGVCTIQPLSALPVIIDTVFIDGYSQPGASVASSNAVLKIVLDGSNAGDGVNGLVLETDESTIRGLNIHSFRVTKIDHPNQDFDFTHGNGIVIREGMTNTITGNFIGTNVDGDACVGNGGSGVLIGGYDSTADANRNTVGGTDPADRNVITCNGFQRDTSTPDPDDGTATGADGVTIRANRADSTIYSADGNQVLGNYISTDVTGMTTLAAGTQTFTYDSQTFDITYMGNTGNGVRIAGGSSNTVGGTTPGARNIISGNEAAGVRVEAVVFDDEDPPHTRAASNNVVQGNYIGTDVNGAADLGNLDVGVYIVGFVDDADGNQIGGTTGTTPGGPCTGACNLISGNGGGGVMILGSQASGNEIKGNYIGTDVNGAAAIPNTAGGIAIADAEDNTIGGATPEERNLISGNGGYGISIVNNAKAWSPDLEVFMGAGEASGNTIQGNYIGAEVTGAAALSNTLSGVLITDAADNVVSENLISGNGQNGVLIMTTGGAPGNVETNVVTAEGSANGDSVKGSDSAAVTVGGTSWLEVTKTADPTHLAPPGGTVTFTIGITNSGVLDVAIKRLSDSSHGNLNGQGSCLVPQTLGPGLSYTCVFSATVSDATGDSATDTVTASGTDANGTFVINSDSATVNITDLPPSILVTKTANPTTLTPPGGTVNFTVTVKNISVSETATITKTWDSKHGDLIPGVCAASVTLGPGDTFTCNYQGTVSGATGNTVEGNFIGTNVTGNAAVPNQGAGVVITSAPDNAIGGATAAQGNVISGNAREGVAILGTDATGNSLRHNVIGGTSALGNGSHGVSLARPPSHQAIGKGSAGNTNAYNGGGVGGGVFRHRAEFPLHPLFTQIAHT